MSIIAEINEAIQDEIKAIRRKYKKSPIVVDHLKTTKVDSEFYYEGIIKSYEDGDILSIPEGVGIKVIYREWDHISREWVEHRRDGKLLYYSLRNHHIVFSITGAIIELPEKQRQFKIEPTAEDLAKAIQEQLAALQNKRTALSWQILNNNYKKTIPPYRISTIAKVSLNESQLEAVTKMFENDVTFLWGPPGTGKTTTIATAIREMIKQGKKVLAVSISNIAVDQIALKCIQNDKYPQLSKGEIIRFGYSKLDAVRNEDILFPSRDIIENLRKDISQLETLLKKTLDPLSSAGIRNKISDKTLELKKATIQPIFQAKATLTTAIQVCLVEEFKEVNYDVVIVDEASMLSIAIVAIVGSIPKERLIIAGDYKQLAPIALSDTPFSKKWLQTDIFELAGVVQNRSNHSSLAMLNLQHRMHEDICEVISDSFYYSKLTSKINADNRLGALLPPTVGKAREFVKISIADGSKVEKTESYSRYNIKTADRVVEIVSKQMRQKEKPTIGVITPYRAQAQRIMKCIKEAGDKSNNPNYSKIKVGTVHSFQGDESDIIIFDLVDNCEEGPGSLYKGSTGHRLMNVAISRAKGKIIIVGDPDLFKNYGYEYSKLHNIVAKYFL